MYIRMHVAGVASYLLETFRPWHLLRFVTAYVRPGMHNSNFIGRMSRYSLRVSYQKQVERISAMSWS
jgi:hypothetical protein